MEVLDCQADGLYRRVTVPRNIAGITPAAAMKA